VAPVTTTVGDKNTTTLQAINGQEIQLASVAQEDLANANLIYDCGNGNLAFANARLMIQPSVGGFATADTGDDSTTAVIIDHHKDTSSQIMDQDSATVQHQDLS